MRTTLDLTGWWDLAESADPARPPDHFPARVPVPGLVDLARPRLDKVGQRRYRFYWYRTTVTIPDQPHDRATLVIKKARYGTAVWLDDRPIGHHYGCFTRGIFPLGRLTPGPHHLVVRLGTPVTLPPWVPWGEDREKTRYIPGIYDDVVLWLSGSPHLENIRVGPRLAEGAVDVAVDLVNVHPTSQTTTLRLTVREAASGRLVGQATVTGLTLGPGERQTIQPRLTIADPHPWSPEDPFLYTLECATDADQETVRFGLREFRYDRASRRAILNGRPYWLRGSNITLYRFFEDPERGALPWDRAWVRRLLAELPRTLHLNSFRFCIGLAPEFWYDIADEAGLLIQDEFPIWGYDHRWSTQELLQEFSEWILAHGNHPCIVTWDACNETHSGVLGTRVIPVVRRLDLADRPWDNGYDLPAGPDDPVEDHPYKFSQPDFTLARLADDPGEQSPNSGAARDRAVIINEYDWLWLQRTGQPTTLSDRVYRRLLGEQADDPEACRRLRAYLMAALTEFWRARRRAAAVQYFCYLGYSRPDGETSDDFIDIQRLILEPHFAARMADAFAPFGVCLDFWAPDLPGGRAHSFTVHVLNDTAAPQAGQVTLLVRQGETVLAETTAPVTVEADGRQTLSLTLPIPARPGPAEVVARLSPAAGGRPVESRREVTITGPEGRGPLGAPGPAA